MKKGLFILLQFAFAALAQAQFPDFSAGYNAEMKNLDSLLNKLSVSKTDQSKVDVLNSLARVYYHLNKNDSLQYYAKQAFELSQKLGYRRGTIAARTWLVEWLVRIGDYPTAIQIGLQNLKDAEQAKDTLFTIYANRSLALTYNVLKDGAMLNRYTGRNKQLVHSGYFKNERERQFYSLIGYATLRARGFGYLKKPDSAFYYIKQAYQAARYLANNDALALTTIALASYYQTVNQYDSAFHYHRMSVAYTKEAGVRIDRISSAYLSMARLFQIQKRPDSVLYYSKEALRSAAGIYATFELNAAAVLNEFYASQNQIDSAYKYLSLASALKDSLFSEERIKQIQSFGFNERLRQQQAEQERREDRQRYKTMMKLYGLIAGLAVLLLVAFVLWRNNRQKQKANTLLQQKNAEIDTQRNKAERALDELKATQAQLVHREKMASLGEVTAGIAHEIQNPLNFINNFSELNKELISELKQEAGSGHITEVIFLADTIEENEQKINHHGQRADAIVKGMLQHSRMGSGSKEPTDINQLADEYLRLSYHGLRTKDSSFQSAIKTEFDKSIGEINLNPQDIGRVLLNLFNNAFYAVNEKKKSLNGAFEPEVSVTTKKVGNNVQLLIRDNGTGIPPDVQRKIFQPFFTTKPTGEGTGLGLSLSYDIITKGHGGEIKVETREGGYTEFAIKLPLKNGVG